MSETPDVRSASSRRGRTRLTVGVACTAILTLLATAPAASAHADTTAHADTRADTTYAGTRADTTHVRAHLDTTHVTQLPPDRPVITSNQTGTHDGYFYAYWKDVGNATMTLGPQGQYSAHWNGVFNWFGGKGWATGHRRTFNYCATFQPGGVSFLSLYGYTTSPIAEYYVVENWGSWRPTGTAMGTVVSEGSTYDIYRQTLGVGITPYYRYYSVRRVPRSSGTINTGDHFDAWARAGLNLDAPMGYMIMATEGYQSNGRSSVTVDSDTTRPQRCTPSPNGAKHSE